jgi:hypothetical protein
MATYATQTALASGLTPTYNAAAGGGDTLTGVDDHTQITIVNGHSSSQTVTFAPVYTPFGETITPRAVAVPNGQSRVVRLPSAIYGNSVAMTYSGVTLLTFASIKT